MKIAQILSEMPYLHDEELGMQTLAHISEAQLARAYDLVAELDQDVRIYQNSEYNTFIAGYWRENAEPKYLSTTVMISTRKNRAYPAVTMSDLGDEYYQVSMVNVQKKLAESGITKKVYNAIAKLAPLVSDHEQYLGAKGLWKSLARDSDVNVYVFNCDEKTYTKYDSKNVDDYLIWGDKHHHRTMLLVATTKTLPTEAK